MRTETCSRCGEETRWGWRPGPTSPVAPGAGFWMHRDPETDADHTPTFGYLMTPEDWAHIEAELDKPRYREDGTVYTTRTYRSKGKADDSTEAKPELEIPDWEIKRRPLERGEDVWPGGCSTIANLLAKNGGSWMATYARGPRLHSLHGTLLGISDWVVMAIVLDGTPRRAVGFWVDGKFTHSWLIMVDVENRRYNIMDVAGSKELKAWIKGES